MWKNGKNGYLRYTGKNADFGYFGYCEIYGFWIKSWFLDKSVLFWGWVICGNLVLGGFPIIQERKAWFWVGHDSILGLCVRVILLGYAVQNLGQVLGWSWPGRRFLGWDGPWVRRSRVEVVGRDRKLGWSVGQGCPWFPCDRCVFLSGDRRRDSL